MPLLRFSVLVLQCSNDSVSNTDSENLCFIRNIFKKPIRSTCGWGHSKTREEKLGVASFVFSYKVANGETLSVHVPMDLKIWEPKIPEKAHFSSSHFEDCFTEKKMGFDTKLILKSDAVPSSEFKPTRWLTGTFIILRFSSRPCPNKSVVCCWLTLADMSLQGYIMIHVKWWHDIRYGLRMLTKKLQQALLKRLCQVSKLLR